MKFPGFVGPSYKLDAYAADVQRTVNLYPEAIESGSGQNVARLVATPGTSLFATIGGENRGIYQEPGSGRLFTVAANTLYEVSAAGALTNRGQIPGSDPVSWASNRDQMAICGGSALRILDLATNALTAPLSEQAGQVVYIDGYALTFQPETQQFQISDGRDWSTWNAMDFASKEGFPDNLVGIFADHRELWLMGSESIEVWGDTGNVDFPFERLSGSHVEQGLRARDSVAKLDNTIVWLGGSARGGPIAFRASGYTPQRISTHAQEIAWSRYARHDDAIGRTHVWNGHAFYVLTFPTANDGTKPTDIPSSATWVFDAATGLWHERAGWIDGQYRSWVGIHHATAFGKALVAGTRSGNLYELSDTVYADADVAIRRERTFPHLSSEQVRLFFASLELLIEKGVGLNAGQGSDPQIMMQYSDDGGKTWGSERWITAGKVGEYRTRVRWLRLGSARDRVFRIAVTDPVPWSFVGAYIEVEKGIS